MTVGEVGWVSRYQLDSERAAYERTEVQCSVGERKEMKWDERKGNLTAAARACGRRVPVCKRF
jgi:hypothetical protein